MSFARNTTNTFQLLSKHTVPTSNKHWSRTGILVPILFNSAFTPFFFGFALFSSFSHITHLASCIAFSCLSWTGLTPPPSGICFSYLFSLYFLYLYLYLLCCLYVPCDICDMFLVYPEKLLSLFFLLFLNNNSLLITVYLLHICDYFFLAYHTLWSTFFSTCLQVPARKSKMTILFALDVLSDQVSSLATSLHQLARWPSWSKASG